MPTLSCGHSYYIYAVLEALASFFDQKAVQGDQLAPPELGGGVPLTLYFVLTTTLVKSLQGFYTAVVFSSIMIWVGIP
jgi:hypothetical protein